jgi:hypothetical protein
MRVSAETYEPYKVPPVPFEEKQIGWKGEPWDKNLPKRGGFLRDFVYGSRGFESPTAFCAWTALWCVSAAVRRSAWFAMYPGKMYPNLYVILVAPAAICKKSTIIKFGCDIVRMIPRYIPNETLRKIKDVRMILNKVTPEGMVKRIKPLEIHVDGEGEPLDLGSQLVIVATEMSTLLGKQTYNMGFIELLLDFYDCPDYWEYTKSGGVDGDQSIVIPVRKAFISLIVGTTPDGLAMSVPETAFGDGFMSRVLPVFQEEDTRIFPDPFQPVGAPSQSELGRRLSWISVRQVGEYHLGMEARKWWEDWYHTKFTRIRRTIEDKDPRARFDVVLKKLSLLMRLQRYEEGDEIDLRDILDAKQILDATYELAGKATADVGLSQFMKNVKSAEKRIQYHGIRTRRQMLTEIRGWRDAYECTRALQHLHDSGKVRIYRGDKEVHKASIKGTEEYRWIGGMEERFTYAARSSKNIGPLKT